MSIISKVTNHTHCRSLTTPTVGLLTLAISEVCSDDNQRYSEGGGVLERLVLLIVVGELGRRGLDRMDGNRGDVSVTCMKGKLTQCNHKIHNCGQDQHAVLQSKYHKQIAQ